MDKFKRWLGKRQSAFRAWYRAYSILHRFSMVVEWLEKPSNARFSKWVIRFTLLGVVALAGFVLRGSIEASTRHENGFIDRLVSLLTTATPSFMEPYLTDTITLIGFFFLQLLVVALVLAVLRIIYLGLKSSRIVGIADHDLRQPTPEVQQRIVAEGESETDYFAVGGAIEIGRHPYICCDPSVSGWDVKTVDTSQVLIEHDVGAKALYDLSLVSDIPAPKGHNGKKYALIATPVDYLDASPKLSIQVRTTDYYTIQKFLALTQDPEIKNTLASMRPEDSKVPNSLCLHYLVQLADGNILCSVRHANTDYSQGQVSLTGEEQLSEIDVNAGASGAASHWFKRALCEEIFPLRVEPNGGVQAAWEKVQDYVSAMRIYSLVYEEYCANFALVGYAQINLDLYWFKMKYSRLRQQNLSGRDKEGTLFVINKSELLAYFRTGQCTIHSVWGERSVCISDKPGFVRFHPTSRYRALMLLLSTGALNDRSLEHPHRKAFDYSLHSGLEAKVKELEDELMRARLKTPETSAGDS